MKIMYKRSALGIVWTLITPVLTLLVFAFLFHGVLSMRVGHYASYAFTGLLSWIWFQSSLFWSTRVIINNRSMLMQPGFPPAVLPVAVVTNWLVHFALAVPLLAIFFVADGIVLKPLVLLLPILMLLQFVFTLSLAYPLAALSVPFGDTQQILNIILNLAFQLTPIFYSVSIVPERYQWFYQLNPMRHIIAAYRDILINGTQPDWTSLAALALLTMCLLPLGYSYFKRASVRFVEDL